MGVGVRVGVGVLVGLGVMLGVLVGVGGEDAHIPIPPHVVHVPEV